MQTIIGTFDDVRAANAAAGRLIELGFPRNRVHVQSGTLATETSTAGTPEAHHGFMADVEHFFKKLFGSDADAHEAGTYAEAIRRGSTVVAVDAMDQAELDKASRILGEFGSIDVSKRAAEWKSQGWTGFDATAKPIACDTVAGRAEAVAPVVQEELQVGKRVVEGGGVRIVKRMTEVPVTELVNLRTERATVERRPVDRPATEADFANFKEGTLEVREKSEEVVVNKQARVVEEVVVGKDVSERKQKVTDTVRRTDVKVERVPDTAVRKDRPQGKPAPH